MLREKRPCSACASDETRQLRDCGACKKSLCTYCASEHVCGEDGRPELVKLLDDYVTDCDGASALTMLRVGGVILAYMPANRTISSAGARVLVRHEVQGAKRAEASSKNIAESLCRAPLGARGAICIVVNGDFRSYFAAKKADDSRITEQFRVLLEVERLANF